MRFWRFFVESIDENGLLWKRVDIYRPAFVAGSDLALVDLFGRQAVVLKYIQTKTENIVSGSAYDVLRVNVAKKPRVNGTGWSTKKKICEWEHGEND